MEVPGIAPGSAEPSPSVSTCVFEDQISPTVGLLNGPLSASHSRLSPSRQRSLRPATETSPNYRRSPDRLGRAAWGTGHVSYAAKAKLSLAVVFFSRCFTRFRETSARYLRIRRRVESSSPPCYQSAAPQRTRGPPRQPSPTCDTNPTSRFRQSPGSACEWTASAFDSLSTNRIYSTFKKFIRQPGRRRDCLPTRRR